MKNFTLWLAFFVLAVFIVAATVATKGGILALLAVSGVLLWALIRVIDWLDER